MIDILSKPDPAIIISYDGYANKKSFTLNARVIEDEGLRLQENNSIWHNASNFIKRLESDEKSNAHVRLKWNGEQVDLLTDQEGYIHYTGEHGIKFSSNDEQTFDIHMDLIKDSVVIHSTSAEIIKPADNAKFMVISDMDDTVIHTGVSSAFKWKLMVNSIFKDSHKRLPLEGAKEFYDELRKPSKGTGPSSFFYISNSPWNIHDYLSDFLDAYEFPKGTMMLRDIEIRPFKKEHYTESNKYLKVMELLNFYPDQKAILIGDAAEIDTDIYISIAVAHPNQVEAIYIRTVEKGSKIRRVKKIIEKNSHVNVKLVKDSNEALAHAQKHGFIN